MGEIDRPATGIKMPMTYRGYGIRKNDVTLDVGTDLEAAQSIAKDADAEVMWRAITEWQSLDTMG